MGVRQDYVRDAGDSPAHSVGILSPGETPGEAATLRTVLLFTLSVMWQCDSVTVWQLCDSDSSEICVTIWWKLWWQSERGSFGDLEVAQQAKLKMLQK